MTIKYVDCPDLKENRNVSFYVNINEETYKFYFQWNDFCNCCFLSIFDSDGNEISTGNALVNKTRILSDKRKIPNLTLFHKNMLSLEPIRETMSDYRIFYADNS